MKLLKSITGSLFTLSLIILVVSCSKNTNTIEGKKAELIKLKGQLVDLQAKVTKLEKEVAESGNGNSTRDIVPVEVKTVTPETFLRFINVQGTVESDKVATISCKMGGPVISILVQEGSLVKKGQLLLQLDDETIKKSMEELKTGLGFAEDNYNRQKRLWEKKAVSEMQFLQAKNAYDQLVNRLETMKNQIDNAKIYAPFSGYVDFIFPKIGETVMPGQPVIKLADMSNIKVTADISESYISTIKAGTSVSITIPELKEKVEGKITTSAKAIDPKNRTFRIEVQFSKTPQNLRPYMICGISINDVAKQNSITAPLSALQRSGEKFFLFIAENSNGMVARKRMLETGLTNDTQIEVFGGLSVNDQIITNGYLDVSDGQKISIQNAK